MYPLLKRLIDIVGAGFGIIIFSPVFLITAVAIKLDSPGPILVEESDRVGRDEKIFRMYKFRSMIRNAHVKIKADPKFRKLYKKFEKNDFKLSDDPRVTQMGLLIRKTSIDELPQFFNVLKGDMSLVGPRSMYPEELKAKGLECPDLQDEIERALKAKPGISGPWQVSGRSDIEFRERILLDAEYAGRKSLLYDLLILAKTIPAVIKGRGAQ